MSVMIKSQGWYTNLLTSDNNEYVRTAANGYIEDYLRVKPVLLEEFETDIMEYLGIEGEYDLLDDSKKRMINDIMYTIRKDSRTVIKKINLEEELEEDPFSESQWLILKDMPDQKVNDYVRTWNDSVLNDPDQDWDPFEPGKEKLK